MTREPPSWNSDADSAAVLMEYLRRASPELVAVELDQLGLLHAADEVATMMYAKAARREARLRHPLVAMVALAACAMLVIIAETRYPGMNMLLDADDNQLMQLAGPTPEW